MRQCRVLTHDFQRMAIETELQEGIWFRMACERIAWSEDILLFDGGVVLEPKEIPVVCGGIAVIVIISKGL